MFIFTLNTMKHFKTWQRISKITGRANRCRTGISTRVVHALLSVVILTAIAWPASPAAAIEFVTREDFTVEKNSYKDYPYRVLFQKFHNSSGAEKRKIRNVIILKQVFDPEIRQRAIAAGAKFETYYGVIKTISADRLRLWLPESDSFKDFQVDINRIPVENKHDYPVSPATISDFAAIVNILDNRVYKVMVSFALTVPEKLKVKRRDENNIVSWEPPANVQTPSGYRVFVNDKFYKAVAGTSIEVPRSKEQADEFFVKAVYTHQKGRIESAASPTLYDVASARELEKRQQAGEVYNQFAAALRQPNQQAARTLLDENRLLLAGFLSPDRQAHILTAGAFFKALDTGARLTALRPETPENLTEARTAFQRAADEAGRLPADFKLSEVARARLDQNSDLSARLTVRLQKEKAGQILAQISADIQPGRWENARKYLYQQQAFLRAHLDQKDKASVEALAGFFHIIEKGDLSAAIQPPAPRHLEAAMQSYRQAEIESRTLPQNLDAGFIALQKIKATASRQASLAAEQQAQQAVQTWDKLLVDLNPSGWQNAKMLLYENRAPLSAHLPFENKATLVALVDFFTSLDEGDRLAANLPATMENLDTAAMYYQRASQKAATLPDNLDIGFITQIKTSKIKKLKTRLQTQLFKEESEQAFAQVTAALDTGQWREARRMLYAKQDLLTRYLDARHKAACLTLIGFFRDIDEGDRLAGIQPLVKQNLEAALDLYQKAEAKGQTLPKSLDPGLIARQKIRGVMESKDLLARGQQEALARKTYDQIVFALSPGRWDEARKQLLQSRDLLLGHLDSKHKAAVTGLLEFFGSIDAGDRLQAVQPETLTGLDKAAAAYQQAGGTTAALSGIADLASLVTLKTGEVNDRKKQLLAKQNRQSAEQTYTRISTALDTGQWQTARELVYTKQELLTAHLDPQRKADCLTLAGFFRNIDKGDRLAGSQPATGPTFDSALESYRQAAAKAQTLPASLDVGLLARQKIRAVAARKNQIAEGAQKTRTQLVYNQIIATLTSADWENARPLLAQNEALLAAHLDADQKAVVSRLLNFFQLIEDGDRLSAQPPVTLDNLNMALSSYRLAAQKSRNLSSVADLSFLTDLKIRTNGDQRTALENRAKQAGAREIYQEIEATLNPTGWETGMRLSLDKLPPVLEDLNPVTRSSARLLISFFQDIKAGDQLSFTHPETDSNLAKAREHYLQAVDKARSLVSSMEVMFIVRARLDALTAQRADLVKRQQARMAAQQAPVPAPAPPPPPPPVPAPAPPSTATTTPAFDNSVDAKTALNRGLKTFSSQNYDLSLKYFKKVYAKQIRKLKKAGKKQSFAVLGLPPQIRAEIIFLVQLELLKERGMGDADVVRDGLMEMMEDVEAGSGSWSIIKERKRNKISKHIDRYPL